MKGNQWDIGTSSWHLFRITKNPHARLGNLGRITCQFDPIRKVTMQIFSTSKCMWNIKTIVHTYLMWYDQFKFQNEKLILLFCLHIILLLLGWRILVNLIKWLSNVTLIWSWWLVWDTFSCLSFLNEKQKTGKGICWKALFHKGSHSSPAQIMGLWVCAIFSEILSRWHKMYRIALVISIAFLFQF